MKRDQAAINRRVVMAHSIANETARKLLEDAAAAGLDNIDTAITLEIAISLVVSQLCHVRGISPSARLAMATQVIRCISERSTDRISDLLLA